MTPSTDERGLYDERTTKLEDGQGWKQQWSQQHNQFYWQNTEFPEQQKWVKTAAQSFEARSLPPPFQSPPQNSSYGQQYLIRLDSGFMSDYAKVKWGTPLEDDYKPPLALPEGREQGDYVSGCMVVDLLPIAAFWTRLTTSGVVAKAWVRAEYIRMIRAIEAQDYLGSDPSVLNSINFITGQPGSGKTIFGGCLLRYRLAFRKPTIFVTAKKQYILFDNGTIYKVVPKCISYLLDAYAVMQEEAGLPQSPIWIIADSRTEDDLTKMIGGLCFRIIYTASPDSLNNHRSIKKSQNGQGWEWFYNPWSTWELHVLHALKTPLQDLPKLPDSTIEVDHQVKTLTGPIPQTLMELWMNVKSEEEIKREITQAIVEFPKNYSALRELLLAVNNEQDISRKNKGQHNFLLYRRFQSEEQQAQSQGGFNFLKREGTTQTVISFMCDHAADVFYETLAAWDATRRSDFFYDCLSTDIGRSLAGALFEREFHHSDRVKKLRIYPMEMKEKGSRYTTHTSRKFPRPEELSLEGVQPYRYDEGLIMCVLKEEERLKKNRGSSTLFVPLHKNNEGIDSFTLSITSTGQLVGWCIQETIVKEKLIVKAGHIIEQLKKRGPEMLFQLLFVLPDTKDFKRDFECSEAQVVEGKPSYTYFKFDRDEER
ncbi:MAG: hypothetical protein M1820_010523 [Bogoriella megaspora]|nr:MAG: hypothetical protein M1820_010523 [Bogoriella megaspora]